MLLIGTVVAGQIDLNQLECFLQKLLLSDQILRLAFGTEPAQIIFIEFCF